MKLDFIFTYLLPPHLQTPPTPPGDPPALVRGRRRGTGPEPPGSLSRSPARSEHRSRRRPGLSRLCKLEGKARSKQPFSKCINCFQNLHRRLIKYVILFIGSVANYLESFNLRDLHVN